MALIKPSKRELIKLAVEKAQLDARAKAQELHKQAAEIKQQAEALYNKELNAKYDLALRKSEELVQDLRLLLNRYGIDRNCVEACCNSAMPGEPIKVRIGLTYNKALLKTNIKVPKASRKVLQLQRQYQYLNDKAKAASEAAMAINEQSVLTGRIAQNLNGEAKKALDTLAKCIGEVALD